MTTTVTVRDATTIKPGGELVFVLALPAERITVRELIRARVQQEVQDYNARRPGLFRGLVRPRDAETTLNGYRITGGRRIDWQKQFETAVESFQRNGFIILVDDRQVADLDEEVEIGPATSVTFLRLVPLVGG